MLFALTDSMAAVTGVHVYTFKITR